MQQQINDVNEAIQDANTNILDFGNSIREIKWDIFDTIQDRISSITTEADFLIELMSSKDLFDDKGQITEHGITFKITISLSQAIRTNLLTSIKMVRQDLLRIVQLKQYSLRGLLSETGQTEKLFQLVLLLQSG